MNELLLKAIRARMQKNAEHNYGILTADSYAKTLLECAGSDLCYRYAARKGRSFDDALKRAAKTLTYNNPDMLLEEVEGRKADGGVMIHGEDVTGQKIEINGTEIEIPKNALMVFRHTLTTPRKDRDGDILRTEGAKPDPKMLLLWQHVHTLPIGKVLGVATHNKNRLSLYTAVVDVNRLAHDAAVMIDNKMGRFSHGFKAVKFDEVKAEPGSTTGGGFDVKEFEIIEASLVSVPSNVDAETEEVLLSLVEGGKLTSPIMKSVGKHFRERTPTTTPVVVDLGTLVKGIEHAAETAKGAGKPECQCQGGGAAGASEETDDDSGKKRKPKDAETSEGLDEGKETTQDNADANNDLGGVLCPVCGITAGDDGVCPNCKQKIRKAADGDLKAGRVLSKANYEKLKDVAEDLKELSSHCSTRTGKGMCGHCRTKVMDVIKGAGYDNETADDDDIETKETTVKEAAVVLLQKSTPEQRLEFAKVFDAMLALDAQAKQTHDYLTMRKNGGQ